MPGTDGAMDGPTVLLRCELDALPILERNSIPYSSMNHGVSHKCGHDGHMAILAAVGSELAIHRPKKGKVVLLFQPAEETGQGAAAIISDPRFEKIKPDFAFGIHNLPGYELGEVVLRSGTFCCASRGMTVRFQGKTAHAAQPETGSSPMKAMCDFMTEMSCLPETLTPRGEIAFATVVGSKLGEKAFGTAPDTAEVWVTLRTETDSSMSSLTQFAEKTLFELGAATELDVEFCYEDIFHATANSQSAVQKIQNASGSLPVRFLEKPNRWSEDFGKFTAMAEGALIGIGAGHEIPDLHDPFYDFPDAMIPLATEFLLRLVKQCQADKNC